MKSDSFSALGAMDDICFPLYAASREIVKRYTSYLSRIGLTYTQYIVMILLLETGTMTSKEIGERLFLDSGTLTPLLKKLEEKGFLQRRRYKVDERNLEIVITENGKSLREQIADIPSSVTKELSVSEEDSAALSRILNGILTFAKS